MSDKPLLIFLHIERTAGTSIGYMCQDAGVRHIRIDYPKPKQIRQIADNCHNWDMVQSHEPYGLHTDIPRNCAYFTMLRNPIERWYSHLSHLRHVRKYQGSFDDAFEMPGFDNLMVRRLGVCRTQEVTDFHLHRAIERLREFGHVGFVEHLPQTVLFLRGLLNVSLNLPHLNSSGVFGELSGLTKRRIQAINRYDVALYEWAKEYKL